MNDGFERVIRFIPAFDRRSEGYGRHCVDMVLGLKGPNGAVELQVFTGWELPHLRDDTIEPTGAYLRFHSLNPRYEGDAVAAEECEWLGGRSCYCGVTATGSIPLFDLLVEEGDDALWARLGEYYREAFGG